MCQIRTPHLLLRDLVEDDISLIRRMAQEPAITRFQSVLRLNSEEEICQWVQNTNFHNSLQPRHAYNLTIVESRENRAIGWIGWGRSSDPIHGEYSFGYALLPEYWGRGYMTEALQAGVTFMFETLGAQGITDYCESTNAGSKRVMEKAGMKLVARWIEETAPGLNVEYLRYAIQRANHHP